jgi:DNA-binding response OmpR family regulator
MPAPSEHPRVLIADENPAGRAFLADNLTCDNYRTLTAGDSEAAIEQLAGPLDALVIDVNGETLAVIDAIRGERYQAVDPDLPILALTSHTDAQHRVRLLHRGADDVITKPYSYPELHARLESLLRRAQARANGPRMIHAGALTLDPTSRRAWVGDVETETLSGKEYHLLHALIAEPDRVFTRQELLRAVWGTDGYGSSRTLDSHAARLRRKLAIGQERYVVNSWGVGYRLA